MSPDELRYANDVAKFFYWTDGVEVFRWALYVMQAGLFVMFLATLALVKYLRKG